MGGLLTRQLWLHHENTTSPIHLQTVLSDLGILAELYLYLHHRRSMVQALKADVRFPISFNWSICRSAAASDLCHSCSEACGYTAEQLLVEYQVDYHALIFARMSPDSYTE